MWFCCHVVICEINLITSNTEAVKFGLFLGNLLEWLTLTKMHMMETLCKSAHRKAHWQLSLPRPAVSFILQLPVSLSNWLCFLTFHFISYFSFISPFFMIPRSSIIHPSPFLSVIFFHLVLVMFNSPIHLEQGRLLLYAVNWFLRVSTHLHTDTHIDPSLSSAARAHCICLLALTSAYEQGVKKDVRRGGRFCVGFSAWQLLSVLVSAVTVAFIRNLCMDKCERVTLPL